MIGILMSDLFTTSLGAAVGGFIGVILFFLVKLKIEKIKSKPVLIRKYLCGIDLNQGQKTEAEGELMHHHGKRVDDDKEYEKIGATHPIWEWNKDPVGRGRGASTIYGPYSTDFYEPGTYSAIFKIKATGISSPEDIINDLILLEIDVNKTTREYTTIPNSPEIKLFNKQERVGIKYIRASDLAISDWNEFEIRFYSDAKGIWEYRVSVNDGLDDKPNNMNFYGNNVRIFFDTIEIKRIKENKLPTV